MNKMIWIGVGVLTLAVLVVFVWYRYSYRTVRPNLDLKNIDNPPCLSGYVTTYYKNSSQEVGGSISYNEETMGGSSTYYNADGSVFASASPVEQLNNKELSEKIDGWYAKLKKDFPIEEVIRCSDGVGTQKGGGLTGTAGDISAKPIGDLRMAENGDLILSLYRTSSDQYAEGQFTYHPSDKDYQLIMQHVSGIKPGETKPFPPFQK